MDGLVIAAPEIVSEAIRLAEAAVEARLEQAAELVRQVRGQVFDPWTKFFEREIEQLKAAVRRSPEQQACKSDLLRHPIHTIRTVWRILFKGPALALPEPTFDNWSKVPPPGFLIGTSFQCQIEGVSVYLTGPKSIVFRVEAGSWYSFWRPLLDQHCAQSDNFSGPSTAWKALTALFKPHKPQTLAPVRS